jgi:hypothetical protein
MLIFVLVVAMILRFYAIRFGEPYRYHPDEVKLLSTAGRLLQTHFVDREAYFAYGIYPVFYTMLLSVLIGGYILFNVIIGRFESIESAQIVYEQNSFQFLLIGRYFVALLGVLSVLLLYGILKRLYSQKTAFIGAALLAVNFVHVRNSHFSTVDVPVTFWTLAAMYFCAGILNDPRRRNYILAAVGVAFAVATKFSLVFLVCPLIFCHIVATSDKKSMWRLFVDKNLLRAAASGAVAFILACPLFLIDFQRTWGGAMRTKKFEAVGKIGSGGGPLSYWTGNQAEGFGVFYPNSIPDTFGLLLTLFVILGLVVLIVRHRKGDLLLLAFVVPTYLMFENMAYRAMRHILPIIPFLLTAGACAILWVSGMLFRRKSIWMIATAAIVVYIAVLNTVRVVDYLSHLKRVDPRSLASAWVVRNVPVSAKIAVESFPPFLPGYMEDEDTGSENYRIFEMDLTLKEKKRSEQLISLLKQEKISYYISDGFTRQIFRWDVTRIKYPDIVADRHSFFSWLESENELVAEFVPLDEKIQPAISVYRLK